MIGIFDSGSGGLTVLKTLKEIAPNADVLYLGDIKNAPYGEKTHEQLGTLTLSGFELLLKEGAEGILSACNSVSAFTILSIFDTLGINPRDVIEMAGPAIEYFKENKEKYRNAAVAATPATIDSGLYQNALKANGFKITEAIPIPGLAGAIEFGESKEKIKIIIEEALEKRELKTDILILGCTHYPLVKNLFEEYLKKKDKNIDIFDPAPYAAQRAVERFNFSNSRGEIRFMITEESSVFRERVESMFSKFPHKIEVCDL